jgi:CubicO group peptidase (beta-lactamase class C family)
MTDDPVSLTAKLDTHLRTLLAANQFSGVVLQAVGGEIMLARGYGPADRELGVAHSVQTLFPIGSLTKPFTAMAILMLVARKQLALAERIRVYLPECPHHWEAITVHHLLSHTAGLPNVTALPHMDFAGLLPASHWALVNLVSTSPLDFVPGTHWAYSNTGYLLLGALIERLTGQSYAEFLDAQIIRPLQLEHTTCIFGGQAAQYAYGYVQSDGMISRGAALDLSLCPAAGGLYSTINDLYQWWQCSARLPLIPTDLLALMREPHTPASTGQPEAYGYGWGIREAFGSRLIYHDGRLPGYKHCLGYVRDRRLLTIVCSNLDWTRPCLIAHGINAIIVEAAAS